jgi:ATP-dependent Clp protease adapter protein ClpS
MSATATRKATTPSHAAGNAFSCKTVLFNCDCHSFDEVERQLIKAIHCSISRARSLSWEVHSKGSAVVYSGPRERCEAVAGVLEDIRLLVRVTE